MNIRFDNSLFLNPSLIAFHFGFAAAVVPSKFAIINTAEVNLWILESANSLMQSGLYNFTLGVTQSD